MNDDKKKLIATDFLAAGHFTTDVYTGFLNPILPFIATHIGIGVAVVSLLMSISYLFSSLMQPLFGFLSDKYKKRFFIVTGMILVAIFLPMTGIAKTPFWLCLFILLGNLGSGFFHPQATGFTFLFSKNIATSKMGIFLTMGTLGYAFGPFLASTIVKYFGLEKLPYTGLFGIILAISFLFFVPKVSDTVKKENSISILSALKEILSSQVTRVLIGLSMLKSLVSVVFCLLLPFLWKEQGFDVFKIGVIISCYTLMGAFATYISPMLEKKIGTKNVFMITMVSVLPISIIMFLTMKELPLLSISMFVLLGFVTFLSNTVNMVLAQKLHPKIKSMISGFIGGFSWGAVGVLLFAIRYFANIVGIIQILIFISVLPFIYSIKVQKLPDEILIKGEEKC